MRVDCFQCGAAYMIPDQAVGPGGARVECPKCGHQETVRPGGAAPGAPAAAPPAAGPASAASTAPEDIFDFGGGAPASPAAEPGGALSFEGDDDPFASLDLGGTPAAPAPAPAPAAPPPDAGLALGAVALKSARPDELAANTPKGYRIKKHDGSIWGPYEFEELKEMAATGSLAPGDQIAKDADEFRLISQYPECAPLLQTAASNFKVRTAAASFQQPKRQIPWVIIGVLGLIALGVAGVMVQAYSPGALGGVGRLFEPVAKFIVERPPPLPPNPVEDDLANFRLEVVDAGGGATQNLDAARKHMAVDTLTGYGEADADLKRALLAQPDSVEALSRLVLNTAYLSHWHPDAAKLTRLVAYARFLEAAAPQEPIALMARASALLMEGPGSAPQARRLADQASSLQPESVEAKLLAARATNLIDHTRAVALLQELSEHADKFPRIETELGLVCEESGDFQCAEKAFRARLKRTPGHEEAAGSLARLYLGVGEHAKAREVYEAILAEDTDRVDLELRLAVMRYQVEGDVRRATRELDLILKKRMDFADAKTTLLVKTHRATLHRLAGQYAKASELLSEVIAESQYDGPANYQAALIALEKGEVAVAADHLASASGAIPDRASLNTLKALVANARKDHEDALTLARRAADESPGDLGRALLATAMLAPAGKPRQAFTRITGLLSIDPIEASGPGDITNFYDERLLYAAVQEGFEALIEREPLQGLSHAGMGISLYLSGDRKTAKKALEKAIELDEQNLPAHVYLGMLAWDAGDFAGAQKAFLRARASDRLSPMPLYLLGRTEEMRKRPGEARKHYAAAKRIDPTFHSVKIREAILDHGDGKKEEAVRALREVMITNPSSWSARSALYHLQ
ncbi:MAG: tetratricopeptide repeat protein [Deltaproteobacteria bacterium]|nr:tetratricopeptide repeat protein [Deltaproteobacteria bacterium]